jgi:hypothetical protein
MKKCSSRRLAMPHSPVASGWPARRRRGSERAKRRRGRRLEPFFSGVKIWKPKKHDRPYGERPRDRTCSRRMKWTGEF